MIKGTAYLRKIPFREVDIPSRLCRVQPMRQWLLCLMTIRDKSFRDCASLGLLKIPSLFLPAIMGLTRRAGMIRHFLTVMVPSAESNVIYMRAVSGYQ